MIVPGDYAVGDLTFAGDDAFDKQTQLIRALKMLKMCRIKTGQMSR